MTTTRTESRTFSSNLPDTATSAPLQTSLISVRVLPATPMRDGDISLDDLILQEQATDETLQQKMADATQRLASSLAERGTLRALRMSHGLSQAELANRAGTTQARISAWESGADILWSSVLSLSEALQLSPAEFAAHLPARLNTVAVRV